MTGPDVLLAFLSHGDASPTLSPDMRSIALAIVQSHPELRTPEVMRAIHMPKGGTSATWPRGAATPGTCDP